MLKSIILTLGVVVGLTSSALANILWDFATGANPSLAEVGSGSATVSPGNYAGGNIASLSALPGGTGAAWDLGQSGSITLSISGLPGGTTLSQLIVRQYVVDTTLLNGALTITPSSLRIVPAPISLPVGGGQGAWFDYVYTLSPQLGNGTGIISIQSGATGALIDKISLQTSTLAVVPEPSTIIAGMLLLLPFGLSAMRILRRATVA